MDIIKNQIQAPVQVLTFITAVKPIKQFLKTWFFNLYFGKSYMNCY